MHQQRADLSLQQSCDARQCVRCMEKGEPCATSVTRGTRSDLLFTMSDNTHPADDRSRGCELFLLPDEQCGLGPAVRVRDPAGGARRDRTDDLLLAKQALSQLSYGPTLARHQRSKSSLRILRASSRRPIFERLIPIMVGLGRLELPTSRLSSARSNQLSYKPAPGFSDRQRAPPIPGLGSSMKKEK